MIPCPDEYGWEMMNTTGLKWTFPAVGNRKTNPDYSEVMHPAQQSVRNSWLTYPDHKCRETVPTLLPILSCSAQAVAELDNSKTCHGVQVALAILQGVPIGDALVDTTVYSGRLHATAGYLE